MDLLFTIKAVAAALIIVLFIISFVIYFFKSTKEHKIETVKELLKVLVVSAEKDLGSGTGQLKLRTVYNQAIQTLPWIVTLITFDEFSGMVDEALAWMNTQLASNTAIKTYVKSEE